MTVREFSAATGWPAPTVRWHCRSTHGMLHEVVTRIKVGPTGGSVTYLIPRDQVEPLTRARAEYVAWRRLQSTVDDVIKAVDS